MVCEPSSCTSKNPSAQADDPNTPRESDDGPSVKTKAHGARFANVRDSMLSLGTPSFSSAAIASSLHVTPNARLARHVIGPGTFIADANRIASSTPYSRTNISAVRTGIEHRSLTATASPPSTVHDTCRSSTASRSASTSKSSSRYVSRNVSTLGVVPPTAPRSRHQ